MGSLCFSSASILRCESFTTLESQLLIIPTALELLFTASVIFKNWGTGRRHLLLTAEGWTYFALALLELLSHNIPAVRDNVSVFSVVDIVLGATSFIPIFFYTLFLYLFTRGELVNTLPRRFQNVSSILLFFFIPTIVAVNELASFIGVSRRTLNIDGKEVVAIGFKTFNDQQLWTFLTSITLALLTAYQAINFCFAFYRLIRAFIDQRRIETTSTDQAHPIRGIGWISAAFKFGAIETVIGFAQDSGFGGALTRRIFRLLSRAFLVIGAIKGLDRIDDFTEITKELNANRPMRRSRMAVLISNPRFSTFQQLTPTASQFYDARKDLPPQQPQMAEFSQLRRDATIAERQPPQPLLRTMTQASQMTAATQFTQESLTHLRPRERVTVHYGSGLPPTLSMRFSGLDMPSPAVIAESVKARPVSSSWVSIAQSSRYAPSATVPSFAFDAPPVPITYPEFIYGPGVETTPRQHQRAVSEFSVRSSTYPDSLHAVHELAGQFPGTPFQQSSPMVEKSEWHDDPESPEPVYHYQYDGQPTSPGRPHAYSPPVVNPQTPLRQHRITQSDTTLGTSPQTGLAYLSPFAELSSTPATEVSSEDPFQYDNRKQPGIVQAVKLEDGPQNGGMPYERTSAALLQMTQREDVDWTPAGFTPDILPAASNPSLSSRRTLKKKRQPGMTSATTDTFAKPWLEDDPEEYNNDEQRIVGPARVKSVGRQRAPQKATPVPVNTKHGLTRGSVYIQPITVPPQEFHTEVQIVQGGSSADSYQSEFTENRN
ncbi:hypothetical protein MIND_01169100 [Mycena indigotica]|uniref:Transmembrane protein n=1 Tax=Mycena indigotica TaxID=2126181 RepID=A0A8H6VSX1_9AGAR|nr:uncharacterized protein MIND_01169100 [Mycena indigotica]KAF7292709.1 hypothetical protein MIND_01169100 [Mycena indigotica]